MCDDKPYVLIETGHHEASTYPPVRSNMLAQTNTYSGKLLLNITTITPLYSGEGQFIDKPTPDHRAFFSVKAMARSAGKVIMPGSGVKGVIRSIYELITDSCMPSGKPNDRFHCAPSSRMCPACALFGFMSGNTGTKGRVTFTDFLLQEPEDDALDVRYIPQLYKPQMPETVCRKFYRHSFSLEEGGDGAEATEVIAKGNHLEGEMVFQIVSQKELGALLFALGIGVTIGDDSGTSPILHKMGYAKSAYFGSVRIELKDFQPYTRFEQPGMTPLTSGELLSLADAYYRGANETLQSKMNQWLDIARNTKAPAWKQNGKKGVY